MLLKGALGQSETQPLGGGWADLEYKCSGCVHVLARPSKIHIKA